MSVIPCESVATNLGDFPPDRRVNYAYGMVLGVDDFQQEQAYHVQRRRLHHGALHGYGVAYGLDVGFREMGARLEISPGMAVDPAGREIVVPVEYCLLLDDWLVRRAADVAERVEDGRLRVCIVLSYRDCLEREVPVPGLPCASADENRAHSRIREAFALRIEFDELDAAAQRGETVTRRLGAILSRIELDPAPGAASDEAAILEAVEALADPDGISSPPLPETPLLLPLADAREALRRIFDVWTARVRPGLLGPEGAGVPLACISFEVGDSGEYVAGSMEIEREMRPVLVNTRTLQEGLFAGMAVVPREAREFATLHADSPDRIRAWVHHPEPLTIPAEAVVVEVDGVEIPVQGVSRDPADLFAIRLAADLPENGRVRVRFDTTAIRVGEDGPSLAESIRARRDHYVGTEDARIHVNTIYSGVTPSRRFVTVTQLDARTVELWFHTDEPIGFSEGGLELRRAGTDEPVAFTLGPAEQERGYTWLLTLRDPEDEFEEGEPIQIVANTRQIQHGRTGNRQLRTWINQTETAFVGWDGTETIRTYHRIALPAEGNGGMGRPSAEFARILPMGRGRLRIWIHLAEPVELSAGSGALTLRADGRRVEITELQRIREEANLFEARYATDEATGAGSFFEARFRLDLIELSGRRGTVLDLVDAADFRWSVLNRTEAEVRTYHLAHSGTTTARRFVTVDTLDARTLRLWFHLAEELEPTRESIELGREVQGPVPVPSPPPGRTPPTIDLPGGRDRLDELLRPGSFEIRPGGTANVWHLQLPANAPLIPRERISLRFSTDRIPIPAQRQTLQALILRQGLHFVGAADDGSDIRAHHVAALPDPVDPERIREVAVGVIQEEMARPLVPVAELRRMGDLAYMACMIVDPERPEAAVDRLSVRVRFDDGRTPAMREVPVEVTPLQLRNQWGILLRPTGQLADILRTQLLLHFDFDLSESSVSSGATLLDAARSAGVRYLGRYRSGEGRERALVFQIHNPG